jgi:hypothetical protein
LIHVVGGVCMSCNEIFMQFGNSTFGMWALVFVLCILCKFSANLLHAPRLSRPHENKYLIPNIHGISSRCSSRIGHICMCVCVVQGHFQQTANWPVVKAACGHVFHSCCVQVCVFVCVCVCVCVCV